MKELPKGKKLNERYVIEDVIGSGGFGITYSAFDTLLNKLVAIKEFYVHKFMTRDVAESCDVAYLPDYEGIIDACREDFMREIGIMKELKDVPYITAYRDSFSENNTEYIVMNLLRGQSLIQIKKKHGGVLSASDLFCSIDNVLMALERIHELGFVHRDVSPGNLFLSEDDNLYLIDFGTATSTNPESELRNSKYFEHRGFNSPEYRDVNMQGAWTDIYSLCATVVYLLTGNVIPSVLERTHYDEVPQLLACKVLTPKQQSALRKGLNIDIENRYQSARELRNDLCSDVDYDYKSKNITYASVINVGTRSINQDNLMMDGEFYYEGTDFARNGIITCEKDELHMIAVCDGVSRASSSELASRAVAQAMRHFIRQNRTNEIFPERLIDELMDQTNEKVISLGKKIGKTGSTLSFLLWKNNQYYAVNIGDSPIYLLRKNKLIRLSTPHIMSEKKIMEGKEVNLKDYHTLVNYLGKENVSGSHMASYRNGHIHDGDRFIVCTDGITGKIDGDKLKKYLKKDPDKAIATMDRIIKKKTDNDNYSAIIVKF